MAEITITTENFEETVLNASLPVLIDFWADWCGPCRMLAPTVEAFAEEFDGKVIVGKVNVDVEPQLADRFRIVSIPTLILIKNGEVVATSVGLRPKADLENLLSQHI